MLLTKAELNLAKLAEERASRYCINGIAVQPDHTVVTNGHYLVAVTHSTLSDKNYPETEGLVPKELENGPAVKETVLLNAKAAIDAAKALPKKTKIPVLGCAALSTDRTLFVNDLESVKQFKSDSSGTFPQWEKVIPEGKPKAEIVLNAEYLEMMARFVREHGPDVPAVRLTIYNDSTSIRFDSYTPDGQEILALLMPMRSNAFTFAKRPHELKAEQKKAEKKAESESPAQATPAPTA